MLGVQPSPVAPGADEPDRGNRYPTVTGDLTITLAGRDTTANIADLVLSKSIGMVRFAARASATVDHLGDILAMGPERQVIRPDTGRVVATMEHPQTVRDWTIGQHPSDAMGTLEPSLELEQSVGGSALMVLYSAGGPDPAFAGSVHLRPEPFGNIKSHRKPPFGVTAPDVRASRGHFLPSIVPLSGG